MHEFISETAKYGDLTRGPRVVTDRTKKEMGKILKEVQSGKFAKQWIEENASGRKSYDKLLKQDTSRQIEKVGAELRARMPWLNDRRA
jgi:ketol-acid reductoisomerase